MLAGGLIISRELVQVRIEPKHRFAHISNYQSTKRELNRHDESHYMKFPCALKNALPIIRNYSSLSFAKKGLATFLHLSLLLLLVACYNYLPIKQLVTSISMLAKLPC